MELEELARVVVPLTCAGCGRPDAVLCAACRRDLARTPEVVDHLGPLTAPFPVHAVAPYTGRTRAVVLAWKSGRRRDLSAPLARIAHEAGESLAGCVPRTTPAPGEELLVVPAPSGMRRRVSGRLVALEFADAVAAGLAAGLGTGVRRGPRCVRVVDLLVRRDVSQAGRDVRARSGRRVVAAARLDPDLPVVLVDDVLTTGATLSACADAVQRAGGRVVGALVLAEAPGRRDPDPPSSTSP